MKSLDQQETFLTNGFNFLNRFSKTSESIEPEPSSYIYKGVTFSHHKDSKPPKKKEKKKKSERLEIKYKSKDKLVKLLNELGHNETAEKMSLCGQKFSVLTCGDHIAAKNNYHRCDIRYCPFCASRRSLKYQVKYLPYAQEFVKSSPVTLTPCLLTLTQKKIKGERLVKSRERMLKSFRNFIRHDFFSEYFAGGLFTVENVFDGRSEGNHLHLHIIIFRKKFINHKLLKSQWAVVSPGAKNLNIKLIDDLESGLKEVIKYVSKPICAEKFKRKHLSELLEIRGKRMIDTFGDFRKFCAENKLPEVEKERREPLSEGQCCPQCNGKLFQLIMSAKELVAFHRRTEETKSAVVSSRTLKLGVNSATWDKVTGIVSEVWKVACGVYK